MTRIASYLKQADIFFGFSTEQLNLIAAICSERIFAGGELVFAEGATSDELYIIIQGEVGIELNPGLVSKHPDETLPTVTIATMRRGQSFGEIALVDQGFRSASARALHNNTRLLIISRTELEATCDAYPLLGYRLMRNLASDLAGKIRSSDLRYREQLLYQSGSEELLA